MPPTKCEPLTFEQTRGTKTFYFPVERDEACPPKLTVMIKRATDGSLHAGVSVCSSEDNFCRRVGRKIAFYRLLGRPLVALNSKDLVDQLYFYLEALAKRRVGDAFHLPAMDLEMLEGVEAAFDMLDENRAARAARTLPNPDEMEGSGYEDTDSGFGC
jgi:hypothetical protein